MASNDNRFIYFRQEIAAAKLLPVKQSFLDEYPIIKEAGDEETDPVYYTEADGLTQFEALELAMPHRVAYITDDYENPPINHGSMADIDEPEGANFLLYAFPKIVNGAMQYDLWIQFDEAHQHSVSQGGEGFNARNFVLSNPKGQGETELSKYLKTGELPHNA